MGSRWLDWHLKGALQVASLLSLGINWPREGQSLQSQKASHVKILEIQIMKDMTRK